MPGASYFAVTGGARPGRILLAEQQVPSVGPPTATQLHQRLRVAPERQRSPAEPAGGTPEPENRNAGPVRSGTLFGVYPLVVWDDVVRASAELPNSTSAND